MATAPQLKAKNRHGFTLIELLIAISLIVIVTGIVYTSLFAVVESTENARIASEELQLRQFLVRNFRINLAQAYGDWRPGASLRRPISQQLNTSQPNAPVEDDLIETRFWLEGIDDSGANGPADTISFATTAPMSGGAALPGLIKQVRYEIVDASEAEEGSVALAYGVSQLMLQCTETPIFEVVDLEGEDDIGGFLDQDDLLGDVDYEVPGWSVPISTMDIQYYDGEDWLDEWDSIAEGRLPWSIRISINFARPEGEDDYAGFDSTEDPDLSLIVPIPAGLGLTEPPIEPIHRFDEVSNFPNSSGGGTPGANNIRTGTAADLRNATGTSRSTNRTRQR